MEEGNRSTTKIMCGNIQRLEAKNAGANWQKYALSDVDNDRAMLHWHQNVSTLMAPIQVGKHISGTPEICFPT